MKKLTLRRYIVGALFCVFSVFTLFSADIASADIVKAGPFKQYRAIKIYDVVHARVRKDYLSSCIAYDSRIAQFCQDINKCTTSACGEAIMQTYDKKMAVIVQAEIDKKIANVDIDKEETNTAIKACRGNLKCIDNVISIIRDDPAFAIGSTGEISDYANNPTGPINSSDNDPTGSSNKQGGPKVDVAFDYSAGAQTVSIMKAQALPSFFNNNSNPEDLYFTWYLKRQGCENKKNVSAGDTDTIALKTKCDLDDDDKITENDWKIAATRIIVAGDFDSNRTDINGNKEVNYVEAGAVYNGGASGYTAIPEIKKENSDDKNIGWRNGFLKNGNGSVFSDNGNEEGIANCYVQESTTGNTYELRRTKEELSPCAEGYHISCIAEQKKVCDVFNDGYNVLFANKTQWLIDKANEYNSAVKYNIDNVPPIDWPKTVPVSTYTILPTDPLYDSVAASAAQAVVDGIISWNNENTPPANWPITVPSPYSIIREDPANNIADLYNFTAANLAATALVDLNVNITQAVQVYNNISNTYYPWPAGLIPVPYFVPKTTQKTTPEFCSVVENTKPFCKIEDENDLSNYKSITSCGENKEPACVKDNIDIDGDEVKEAIINTSLTSGVIFGEGNLCTSFEPHTQLTPYLPVVPTLGELYPIVTSLCDEALCSADMSDDDYLECVKTNECATCAAALIENTDSQGDPLDLEFNMADCEEKENDIIKMKDINTLRATQSFDKFISNQLSPPIPLFNNVQKSIFLPYMNKSCATILEENTSSYQKASSKCTLERGDNLCKHLFPIVPGEVSGDGKFTLNEKEFWGADPTKVSTNGTGKDEEKVVGLGVDEFSWRFSPGDKIGVVVEGESMLPSEHQDASFKRMWAFPKNTCSAIDKLINTKLASSEGMESDEDIKNSKSFYIEGTSGECDPTDINKRCVGFLTADIDINKCLEENLLEPDPDSSAALSVILKAIPENPINDENGRGDILKIVAGAENTQEESGLVYNWSIQKSLGGITKPIETTNWEDITSNMLYGGSFNKTDLSGMNKKELAINLNIKNSVIGNESTFYLRVRVKVTGSATDEGQAAMGEIEIRVKQQQDEIRVYPVTATNAGMLTLKDEDLMERCIARQGETTCNVSKNEIIGLVIPEHVNSSEIPFSWTVNGVEFTCSDSISDECADGNVLFFSVLGNIGESIEVVAKGFNRGNELIEVSRYFFIITPELQIESGGGAWQKLIGYYKDLTNETYCFEGGVGCYPDLSTAVLETNEGTTVTLNATNGMGGFEWVIDGQIMDEYKDQNSIQLAIAKKTGESYNIGLNTYLLPENMVQVNNIRKALFKNWGIMPEDVIEKNQSVDMQLDVVASSPESVANEKAVSFGASLITHLPQQLLFLFKLSLASILMFALTGGLFALMPEAKFKNE